jgi:septum formation protein
MRLVLASASPRRSELLAAAGYTFETMPTDVDERVQPGERPRDYVRRLALEKSAAPLQALTCQAGVAGSGSGRPSDADRTEGATTDVLVIGADTAVIVDGAILGKPIDDVDAARMLLSLSGRVHIVMTGVSIRSMVRQLDAVEETAVFVQPLSPADIEWYVASGEGRDKAGAYAVQGLASRFIPRIEGSYSNVVGLPVARVAGLLESMK